MTFQNLDKGLVFRTQGGAWYVKLNDDKVFNLSSHEVKNLPPDVEVTIVEVWRPNAEGSDNGVLNWIIELHDRIPGLDAEYLGSGQVRLRVAQGPWKVLSWIKITPEKAFEVLVKKPVYLSKTASGRRRH